MIPNSTLGSIAGFERQIATNLTANIQYQNEMMLDHDAYINSLPTTMTERDETYHLITSRVTRMLLMETLTLSGFVFYSPSEKDLYARLSHLINIPMLSRSRLAEISSTVEMCIQISKRFRRTITST